jgi:hypothetical protein
MQGGSDALPVKIFFRNSELSYAGFYNVASDIVIVAKEPQDPVLNSLLVES